MANSRISKYCHLIIGMMLMSLAVNAVAQKSFGSLNVKDVIKVKNGDTFTVNLNYVHAMFAENIPVKVDGVGVPRIKKSRCEKEKTLGLQAKQFTNNFLQNASRIELRNVRRGKQFKIIADVYGDSISLAQELIRTNHAYKREPEKVKKDWCS